MIRFGAPVFLSENERSGCAGESHGSSANDPEALARAAKAKGYTAVYAPKIPISDTARIHTVRDVFKRSDIIIAEVGYWDNLVDTDDTARAKNRTAMTEALALAEELHAQCAVDIFGSYCRGNGN